MLKKVCKYSKLIVQYIYTYNKTFKYSTVYQ